MATHRRRAAPPSTTHPYARILVVDDNAINRLLVQSLLEENGYKADTAIDGLQAIELVLRHRYDLILMDLMMPGMTGIETARRIRALGGKAHQTPIMALSAEDPAEYGADYLSARLDGHIAKPVQPSELFANVAVWLGPRRLRAAPVRKAIRNVSRSVDGPLIDQVQLAGIRAAMSPQSFRALLSSYLDGARARLARIEALLAEEDLLGVAHEAHDLKSTSGSFGAMRLCLLAKQLEKACKLGNASRARDLVSAIAVVSEETWAPLEKST